jgi:hypothetical protein
MMANTRFSKDDDELENNSHYFFDLSDLSFESLHITPTSPRMNRSQRPDLNSPCTDVEDHRSPRSSVSGPTSPRQQYNRRTDVEPRSSASVPISPINQQYTRLESAEIAQMELELHFKNFEMLALIRGTTPREAYELEMQKERSQSSSRCRSTTDFEENEEEEPISGPDNGYLIGDSFIELENNNNLHDSAIYESDGEDEDIFGMEI